MKIYIIGPNGCGKTTLAKALSKKLNISHYELDRLWYLSKDSDIKRDQKEVEKMFLKIIRKKTWIIEDLGRQIFSDGLEFASLIICLDISLKERLERIDKRYFNQQNGLLETSYIINDELQKRIIESSKSFENQRKKFMEMLQQYSNKLLVLYENDNDIEHILKKIEMFEDKL